MVLEGTMQACKGGKQPKTLTKYEAMKQNNNQPGTINLKVAVMASIPYMQLSNYTEDPVNERDTTPG